jgi:acetyl/propionyl-CoA carboxylase alpha subunit/acetyl-CoA carboxylase carboxyltransferase component
MKTLLIANRGEIAIRIARAAADLGLRTVSIYSEDDAASLHVDRADASVALGGRGAKAYLDIAQIVAKAVEAGADAVHPGYGFLSENAAFARAVEAAGLTFVGPSPETLEQLGDKVRARGLAEACGVPVLRGAGPTDLASARAFFAELPAGHALMVKAVSGGGGRGMRLARDAAELEEALARAASEAGAAFGDPSVYVEQYLPHARHIEAQVIGDGAEVSHLWERECSLQRRYQKLVEVAPSPSLSAELGGQITAAAVRMAAACGYRGLGTFEFLVSADGRDFRFIEANARLQVEHTVTEEVLGVDLVQAQLRVAAGASLAELGLRQADIPAPRGFAIQARVNLETVGPDGAARPGGGRLTVFEPPTGPGVRTDTYGYAGYATSPAFDSLIAKVIVHTPSGPYAGAVARARRALGEMKVEGAPTNLPFLIALLGDERVVANAVDNGFIDAEAGAMVRAAAPPPPAATAIAGVRVTAADPLAVLDVGKGGAATAVAAPRVAAVLEGPAGSVAVRTPMQGTLVTVLVEPGEPVWAGRVVAILEAMKMEHEVRSPVGGVVLQLGAGAGDALFEDHPLLFLEPRDVAAQDAGDRGVVDLDAIRPDLQEVFARKAAGLDVNRPEAVAKRRKTGHRTARENIADLCDPGSFVEFGSVVLAAQRRRRSIEDLIANTTGDGMVCGLGHVNGALFPEDRSRVMAMSYDYMVLAGTQGKLNHYKKDRLFEIAERNRLPTVLFAEGGGGRPGDTDSSGVAGLDCMAFTYFAQLSGLVPLIGITTGRCFAGNAVLLGCCDVVIATEGSNIGVGGPAMIEGGGLGVFRPEEVGPMDVQVPNGVVDIAVKDEAEAVDAAKRYLSYFQGAVREWTAPDPRALRFIVPENRLRWYDMRQVIEGIADVGSVLELRPQWGVGVITAFIRVEGRPLGVIANNPGHLAGAIDSPGADKGARFMQLCDAFDIPIVTLVDCPGIMVGPESEKTALVRHASRMMVTGANLETPLMTIVIRKGYGLGAQAMAGGSFRAPLFTVTWPTGEFGGMGLEGAVKLGYRKELQAIEDLAERKALYDRMVAQSYERGKAVNMASHFELDEVIDPAETRQWIMAGLKSLPPKPPRTGKKRPNIDTW